MVIARRGPRRRQGGQGAPLVKGRRPAGSAPALSFRRIFAFVAPYVIPRTREATCLAAASTMSTVLYKASLFLPGISGKLVIDAVSDGALAPADRRSRALAGVAVYFAGRLGAAVFSGLQDVTYERLSQDISRRFGAQTYERLLRLDVSYHTTVPAGRSFDVLNRGIGALSLLLRVVTLQLGPTLVEAAVISSIFVRLGSRAVACTTFTSCAAYVWLTQAITKWRVGYQREIVRAENAVSSKAVETFSSFEAVKMFSTERREVGKYETLRYELQEASVKTRWLICAFHFGQNVIMGLGLVLGMLLTIHDVVRGRLTPGDFSLVFAYMRSLFGPLVWLGSTWGEVVGAVNNLEAVVDVYNTRAVVVDGPEARTLVADPVLIAQRRFGEVAFENVSFHYAQDGAPNGVSVGGIYNVSFRVPPGRVVGICGASGSGKSTIGRVLLRFYQPDAGRVLLDGLDTSRYTLASLRQCIGVIPQETVLFDDTLRYNITYGRPRATDVEVWDAVIAAEMVDFVKQQPLGLDTVTGARGVKTSGGERQRIGAARCICKQPAVVLLDESTSALDAQTEKLVQASFERLFRGRTTVVIAHRLSTIQRADEILVLAPCDDPSASSIVERGTHEQLVAQGGRYAAMWAAQTGEDHAKR